MAAVDTINRPLLDRVSWGALFAGFFVGFACWFLLVSFGAGIGGSAFNPRALSGWKGLSIGMAIWSVIAAIISYFFAGWVTARLSLAHERVAGVLHGIAVWAFMVVIAVWFAAMSLASAVGTAATVTGTAAGGAAGAAAQSPRMSQQMGQMQQQLSQAAGQTGQPAEQRAGSAGQAAATAGTVAAWSFFIYAILTLVAAAIGGALGAPGERRTPIVREERAPTAPITPPAPQRA